MDALALALLVAVLLGLRHATDPDHLTAVTTLVLGDDHQGGRRAGRLGLAWGLGHAATLLALGLPVVLLHGEIPGEVHRFAEMAVGVLIALLALRLLVRWRRGYFHVHPHRHGDVVHTHPHVHEHDHSEQHEHAHERTPRAAFGIGLLHGVGGSAGIGILLVGAISSGAAAVAALVLFAGAAAVSMALVSAVLGTALVRPAVRRRMERLVPALGSAGLLFGVLYALAAV